jgi:CyaY protein
MDDTLFRREADQALDELFDRLTAVGDEHGFEADLNAGALTVEFDSPPGKFVVSPNSPVHQIWVSANVKSYKLEWDGAATFRLATTGQSLVELMAEAIGTHLGRAVTLG